MPIYTEVYLVGTITINPDGIIKKDGDMISFVPKDDFNKDWREYQEWLEPGNTPEPAVDPTEKIP